MPLALVAATVGLRQANASEVKPPPPSEDYLLHCSACHGPGGEGTPGVTPTLHGAGELLDTAGGRSYLARVPGVAQAPLSDARLARLLNWVLERYSGRAPSPPYSPGEVGGLRKNPLRDPVAARKALVAAKP